MLPPRQFSESVQLGRLTCLRYVVRVNVLALRRSAGAGVQAEGIALSIAQDTFDPYYAIPGFA